MASIHGLCVTPLEFNSALGEFFEYCPVDLALHEELVDCSGDSLQFAAEYRFGILDRLLHENIERADPEIAFNILMFLNKRSTIGAFVTIRECSDIL